MNRFSEGIENISPMQEFIGDSGFLLDPYDNDGLQKSLRDTLLDEQLTVELQRCEILRSTKFQLEKTARKRLDVYRRVLKGE